MTRYLSLAEFWYLAEHVTGINASTLIKASRVEPADSALHAPQAGFGDTDFYPDLHNKALARVPDRMEPPVARRQQASSLGMPCAVHRPQRRLVERRPPRHRRRRCGNAFGGGS